MSALDWIVLAASLLFIVVYGVWRGRGSRDLDGYLLANRSVRGPSIALAVMATQASAITFLSTPGQAYADGMRFVQFYFGLPLAMIVLCVTAVPLYRRLRVYTAYEFLEDRFDLKTRTLAALLFLIQRGLAAGLTIYAPAIILSVLLGWNLHATLFVMGGLVVIYTAAGGARAVNHTQSQQMMLMLGGMVLALVVTLLAMPPGVSFTDALHLAGGAGRLHAIDFSADPRERYTLWSGLLGGFFLQLAYFGTDQSQVGRYLTARSVASARTGLVINGLAKVPMQALVLFVGVMVFAFFQFTPPPLYFDPVALERVAARHPQAYRELEEAHRRAAEQRAARARELVAAQRAGDAARHLAAERGLEGARREVATARQGIEALIHRDEPGAPANDTNYVFLGFILRYFPVGVIGIMLAAVFAAAMSSSSAELNALASTTVVDVYRRWIVARGGSPPAPAGDPGSARREVVVSRLATLFWGAFAVAFAELASRLGTLIEAVNILGSLFYGTILGIFLAGFYVKRAGGTAVFVAALIAEAVVIACFRLTTISFLWYNAIGCLLVVVLAAAIGGGRRPVRTTAVSAGDRSPGLAPGTGGGPAGEVRSG